MLYYKDSYHTVSKSSFLNSVLHASINTPGFLSFSNIPTDLPFLLLLMALIILSKLPLSLPPYQ